MGSFQKRLDNNLRKLWDFSGKLSHPNPMDTTEAWMILEQKLDREDENRARSTPPVVRQIRWNSPGPKVALAFSFLVLFSLPAAYFWMTTEIIQSGTGKRISQRLPDGSEIILNAESKLSYKKTSFGKSTRNVTLKGEAFFDIQKSSQPFIIKTGDVYITVVGTEFNVRSRSGWVEVAVQEGIVTVSADYGSRDSTVTLLAGQMSSFNITDLPEPPQFLPYENYPGWRQDQFMFYKQGLVTVCEEIERKFDVKIQLSDETLEDITVTGVIDAADLNSVLSTLSFLTQRNYRFQDETIILY